MECREQCGACCIAPSINQPFWGMPKGKPAGVACAHLAEDYSCDIFTSPKRPAVCAGFQAEIDLCGSSREQALVTITELELITLTNK